MSKLKVIEYFFKIFVDNKFEIRSILYLTAPA